MGASAFGSVRLGAGPFIVAPRIGEDLSLLELLELLELGAAESGRVEI